MDYSKITTGKLNEFENFYGEVEFYNHGKMEIFNLLKDEASLETLSSPELWFAMFNHKNKKYGILANGELTSDGNYIIGELVMKTYRVYYNQGNLEILTDDPKFPKSFTFTEIGINEFKDLEDLREQLFGEDLPDDKNRLPCYEEGDRVEFWLTIDEDKLRETIRTELRNALDFDWLGWRIPIYVDTMTGEISTGSWLSQGSYQPDAFEFYSIKPWEIDWEEELEEKEVTGNIPEPEEATREDIPESEQEEIIKDEIDRLEDFHIRQIKEWKIPDLNKDADCHNDMSEKPDFYIDIE